MRKNFAILAIIVVIGLFLRVISLGTNPPAMHADEADTGYTALSLIETGKDPYGNKWPLQFKDQASNFRAPLYTYSVIPSVYLLGLSPLATRLPSALYGTALIVVVYFLLQKLFKNPGISLIGAFLTAINPWSIHLSRTGLEVQLSVLLTALAILFFLLRDKKKYFLYLSFITFGLSLFSYHPAKIFTPLVIVFLIIMNFKKLKNNKLSLVISSIIFSFFLVLMLLLAIHANGASEFSNVSIFDSARASEIVNMQRTQTLASLKLSSVFSNKPVYYLREFVNHYVGPLSINYLFINGESSLDKGIGNYGQYHLFELLPFLLGLVALWKRGGKIFILILGWFIIALVPAGITKTGYYAYRDVNAMIPPIIITSLGIYESIKYLNRKKLQVLSYFYLVFSFFIFAFFVYNYYFSYPVYARDWWAFSQMKAIDYVTNHKSEYSSTYIQGGLDWNILYAFYNNISPSEFQKSYSSQVMLGDSKVWLLRGIYIGDLIKNDAAIKLTPGLRGSSLLIVPGNYFKKEIPLHLFTGVDGVNINLKAFKINE